MIKPNIPSYFYPDEPEEDRINMWLTLEAEAEEMQRHDLLPYEEPRPPRIPRWLAGCTNEDVFIQRGYI
jgi:hypothetical protein